MSNINNIIYSRYKGVLNQKADYRTADLIDGYEFLDQIKSILPIDKDSRILDLGCGSGDFLEYVKKNSYSNVVGVELSDEYIYLSRLRGLTNVCKIDMFHFLSTTKQSFDCIFLSHVIEHLDRSHTERLMKLIYYRLNSGGCVIIITPNMSNSNAAYYRYMDYTHQIGYTETSLTQLLNVFNFKNISAIGLNRPSTTILKFLLYKVFLPIYYFFKCLRDRVIHYGAYFFCNLSTSSESIITPQYYNPL